MQDIISKISTINANKPSGGRPGPSPAQAWGRAMAGAGTRGSGLGPGLGRAGPAVAWYFIFILDISWLYFWYVSGTLVTFIMLNVFPGDTFLASLH